MKKILIVLLLTFLVYLISRRKEIKLQNQFDFVDVESEADYLAKQGLCKNENGVICEIEAIYS